MTRDAATFAWPFVWFWAFAIAYALAYVVLLVASQGAHPFRVTDHTVFILWVSIFASLLGTITVGEIENWKMPWGSYGRL